MSLDLTTLRRSVGRAPSPAPGPPARLWQELAA